VNGDRVESPCVDFCELSADGRTCLGCFRTVEEIAAWSSFDDDRRREVLAACRARAAAGSGRGTTE